MVLAEVFVKVFSRSPNNVTGVNRMLRVQLIVLPKKFNRCFSVWQILEGFGDASIGASCGGSFNQAVWIH